MLACQRADQAELAFELYQIMKARGLQPKHNNAHSICYTLLKSCYNRIRKGWRPGMRPALFPLLFASSRAVTLCAYHVQSVSVDCHFAT